MQKSKVHNEVMGTVFIHTDETIIIQKQTNTHEHVNCGGHEMLHKHMSLL